MPVSYTYPTEEDKAKWTAIEAEERKKQRIRDAKSEVDALELKNLRKLYDGEDMTSVNAERIKLRNEIRQLEGKI